MFRITVVLLMGLLFPAYCVGQPLGVPAYHLGEPIYLEFRYDGDKLNWDGHIGVDAQGGEPSLTNKE